MKCKMIKKVISSVLVGTLTVSTLVACGSVDETITSSSPQEKESIASSSSSAVSESATVEEKQTVEVTYPIDTDVTLTVAFVTNSTVTANYADFTETPFWNEIQEVTGVKLEAMELTSDAFKLMLTSGELPDLLITDPYNYSGGPEMAIEDQVVAPITDYMEYAPDLMAALQLDEDYRKATTTSEGEIIGAPFIRGDEYLLTSVGMIIRADWLEELNMDIPETPDQMYEVLRAFKEEMGAEVPLSLNSNLVKNWMLKGQITGGFGLVSAHTYQVDGVVHYGFAEKELKDVYTWLNKLYTEGLFDPDFATIGSTEVKSNIQSGRSGLTAGSCGGNLGTWLREMWTTDETYDLAGVPSLVSSAGETPLFCPAENKVPGTMMCMTTACEYPEIAVQLMNYGYTEEGAMLFNYGIEGETYTIVDGYPTYTDWVMNNPDGWSMAQALAGYCRSWNTGPFVQQKEYMEQFGSLPQQRSALEAWTDNTVTDYMIPKLAINTEDSAEYSKLSSEIGTYVDEMMIAYITGAKSLDTFEAEYLATLESLGVDRMIEILQNALDAYNAR